MFIFSVELNEDSEMNRKFYSIGILLYAIVILLASLEIITYILYGIELFTGSAYTYWLYIGYFIFFLAQLVMLKYLHYKRHFASFAFLLLHEISFHIYLFLSLNQGSTIFQNGFLFMVLGTGIMFDLSLLLSRVADRRLLKKAGMIGLVIGGGVLVASIMILTSPNSHTIIVMEETRIWLSMVGNLMVAFFLLNFYEELKSERKTSLT